MRTFIIGDVHGCLLELQDLLETAKVEAEDQVVLVGDLVGKGPYSFEVVQFARSRGFLSVVGNHDEKLLQWNAAKKKNHPTPKLKPTHEEAAQKLTHADWQWLESLPYWIELEPYNVIVVHAGLVQEVALNQQSHTHMVTMRSILEDGSVTKSNRHGTPWAKLWTGPEHIVFGHDAFRKLQQYPHATGLDTGCVYGGKLTGLWLPEHKLVSVPAHKVWHPTED